MADERPPRDRRRQTEVLRKNPFGPHLEPGDQVGEYEIEALIGRGGMGAVYRAYQTVIERYVAIKVLTNPTAPRAVERFLQEARAVGRVRHRAIPDIHTFGTLPDGTQYYVMELLEGEDLRARLRRDGALPPAQALEILEQVADGLHAAHECGIIHRDLKPENIFISALGVKLLDFGIAKLLEYPTDPERHQSIGAVIGTPAYMSPEQLLGGSVTIESDVYSLACVAHEMLSGKRAFDVHNTNELIRDKSLGRYRTLREHDQELAIFDPPIAKALSPDDAMRFSSPVDFVRELRAALAAERSRVDTATMPEPNPSDRSSVLSHLPSSLKRSLYFSPLPNRLSQGVIALAIAVGIASIVTLLSVIQAEEHRPPAEVKTVQIPVLVAPPPLPEKPALELAAPPRAPAPAKAKKIAPRSKPDDQLPEMPIRF